MKSACSCKGQLWGSTGTHRDSLNDSKSIPSYCCDFKLIPGQGHNSEWIQSHGNDSNRDSEWKRACRVRCCCPSETDQLKLTPSFQGQLELQAGCIALEAGINRKEEKEERQPWKYDCLHCCGAPSGRMPAAPRRCSTASRHQGEAPAGQPECWLNTGSSG